MLPYGGYEWNCRELRRRRGTAWAVFMRIRFAIKRQRRLRDDYAALLFKPAKGRLTRATPLASEFESGTWMEAINSSLVRKVPAQ
jgi:hypothetical protein